MDTPQNSDKDLKGIVSARKCLTCGHHEIGLTAEDGTFIALTPGMKASIESSREKSPQKTKAEIAVEKFKQGFNCAQSVLFAFSDVLKFDSETALKLACGLGAGMGRKQEVCGAVSGGILALGLKYGKSVKDDNEASETTYAKTRTLIDRFEKAHGSINCRKLIDGCDLLTEQGQTRFLNEKMLEKVCFPNVKTVVTILEDIL